MRFPIYTVVVPILAAVTFAQDTPPVQQPTESTAPSKPGKSSQGQSDRTGGQNPGTTGQTPGQNSGAHDAQASGKTGGQSSDRLPEMKTQMYSGTLTDASCAGSGAAATTATPSASATAGSAASPASKSSADRSAGSESNQSCAISASTTQFALKMKDGNTVRFDDVGNARVQEAMKTHKSWSDSASASKPIHVKASGVLNGDKLTVISVN